jgi:hypothetical protein
MRETLTFRVKNFIKSTNVKLLCTEDEVRVFACWEISP